MPNAPKPGPAPKADPPAVTTADTAALAGAPTAPAEKNAPTNRQRIVVSQGVFEDLTRLRKVTDPGSGYALRVGHDGTVTAYDRRTAKPAEDVDVICPPVPAAPAEQA